MSSVISFGCRLNIQEGTVIENILTELSLEKNIDKENTIVINTCAVTEEAIKKGEQYIRRVYRNFPNKKIIVTGCGAQLYPERFSKFDGVSQVIGNLEKLQKSTYNIASPILVRDINKVSQLEVPFTDNYSSKCRAFVQIQNGCDHDCTFCVTTIARGNNRSLEINKIVEQVQKLVENGHKEVVFTGVDITDYGKDLYNRPSLGSLIKRVLQLVPDLPRLRLSSLDVAEIDEETIELILSEKRLLPYLHLSVQSGDDLILKRMKRRHTREQVIKFCTLISNKRPDIVFGADIITGFPTESDEMFQNTKTLIETIPLTHLHVFPYSVREGTKAAKMPQIPISLRRERAQILLQVRQYLLNKLQQTQLGIAQNVLVEKNNVGYTENFILIKIEGPPVPSNSLVKAIPIKIEDKYLMATLV